MILRCSYILLLPLFLLSPVLHSQSDTRTYLYTGVVYDEENTPIPHTHVIARGTGNGDITDSNGIFQVYTRKTDLLSFYNIATRDTSVVVSTDDERFIIVLRRRYYPISEAKIFDWGSTYGEFLQEVKRKGTGESISQKLELPKRDDDYVPFNYDEERLKSLGFFINSPVSFLYHNLSRYERSKRKAWQLEQDKEKIDRFNRLLSPENIAAITGLEGRELEAFMLYLNQYLTKTCHDSELEILTGVHVLWDHYKEIGSFDHE